MKLIKKLKEKIPESIVLIFIVELLYLFSPCNLFSLNEDGYHNAATGWEAITCTAVAAEGLEQETVQTATQKSIIAEWLVN